MTSFFSLKTAIFHNRQDVGYNLWAKNKVKLLRNAYYYGLLSEHLFSYFLVIGLCLNIIFKQFYVLFSSNFIHNPELVGL